jgi:hypothetical protein
MLSVITIWAEVDSYIGLTLVRLLGADAKELIELFIQRVGSSQQRALLLENARALLSPDQTDCLEALLRMFAVDYRGRNRLVHWISGYSNEVPNGILFQDPGHSWREQVAFHEEQIEQLKAMSGAAADLRAYRAARQAREAGRGSRLKHVSVYTEADFQQMRTNAGELRAGFMIFPGLLSRFERARGDQYARLCALPRFLPTLSRMRDRRM